MKQYDFHKKLSESITDINILIKYLKKHFTVIDVQHNKNYFDKDIDIIIKLQDNGATQTVEIKADNYTSGNFFIETMSNEERNTESCLMKSQADKLFYYFTKTNIVYIFNMKDIQKWISENKDNEKIRTARTQTTVGNGKYTTVGKIVPIKTLVSKLYCVKLKI